MRGKYMAVLLAAAVAAVAALLGAAIFLDHQEEQSETGIVLPSEDAAEVTAVPSETEEESGSSFVEITSENVLTVIQTLQRPDCYYQTFSVERAWEDGSSLEDVEVWRQGDLYRIALSVEGQDTRYYLTDGETLYFWYEEETSAVQTTLPEGWSVDDLAGIPTYEEVLDLEESEIQDASSVELGGLSSSTCVYICYTGQEEGREEYLWIDMDSGMLLQAHTVQDGSLTYRMQQTELQILTATDTVFEDCFLLPDGTEPFGADG